jgi:hypothetical protein
MTVIAAAHESAAGFAVRCDASTAIAIGGITDISGSLAAYRNDANDPERTNCPVTDNRQFDILPYNSCVPGIGSKPIDEIP